MAIQKICIVGLDDYAMLSGDAAFGHVGGESVQHVLLARAWRDLGLDVSIVVYDLGQPRVTTVGGIRAISAFRPDAGLRVVRFAHPRITGLLRAMGEADADVYYQSPAAGWSGITVWFARRFAKRSIIRIASDIDCIPGKQAIRYRRDRWLFDYALRNASLVAAQTLHQQQLLSTHYRIQNEIVNLAMEVPAAALRAVKDIDALWVGNLRPIKRPDLVLDLARRLPQYQFALIGGSVPEHKAYFGRIAAEARNLPNLIVAGRIPYEKVGAWFERSRLHINTSDVEGFPNTFLQAWIRSVPVVSFFDPDGLIEHRKLGRKCRGFDEMAAALDGLLRNEVERTEIGARAREFAASAFSAHSIAARYLELLELRTACGRGDSNAGLIFRGECE
jgi:glycosyltransferase involved in cell wall biosynthesis